MATLTKNIYHTQKVIYTVASMNRGRPTGVTIVAFLMIANGVILISGGVLTIIFAPAIIQPIIQNMNKNLTINSGGTNITAELATSIGGAIMNLITVVSGVAIALGAATFPIAWGLFTVKGWAWLVTVIICIILVIIGIISLIAPSTGIITLIISGIILYYLYRPQVKGYFGRVKIPR